MNDFSLSFPQTLLYFNLMNIIYPTSLEPFLLRTPNLNIIRMTHSFSWSRDRDPFRNCLYFFNVAHVKRLQNELRSSEYRCDASTEQLFTWASVFRLVSMNGNIHQKEGCSIWEKGLRCISLGARSSVFYVSAFPMNLELCFVREHEFTDARDAREQSRTLAALSRDSSRISIDRSLWFTRFLDTLSRANFYVEIEIEVFFEFPSMARFLRPVRTLEM